MSYLVLDDKLISQIASSGDRDWLVLEHHPDFKGQWIVESLEPSFFFDFKDLIGPYRALSPVALEEFLALAKELGFKVAFGEDPTTILDAFTHLSDPPSVKINSTLPGTINGFLPYQVQGFNFLRNLDAGVVMWSTGTGKTVVATGLLKEHLEALDIDIAFFVVKAHNKINTQRTLERLASIESIVLDGPKKRREKVLSGLLEAPPGTVLVTNYEKFRVDHELLLPLVENRRVLIIWDEMPTKLKNRGSQVYEAVRKLLYSGSYPSWDNRRPAELRQYMLSATPIENDPEDFFNCMRLLDPRIFGNVKNFYKQFVARFSYFDEYKPESWHNLEKMGLVASHVVHQVDKEDPDIANQFPKVLEEEFYIDWDEEDIAIYNKLSKAAKLKFAEREEFEEEGILALISVMQMLCDAPSMVNNSAALREQYNSLVEELGPESVDFAGKKGSKTALELLKLVGEKLTDDRHTKLDTLRTLLTETHKDEKVVVFTTFNDALMPILTSKFDEWGVTYVTYRGGINDKQNSQDKFLSDGNCQVFLSSDAGSDSINLEVASVVIHYDLPWKYSTLVQRQNRIHRVTSDFEGVRFYTLLMANSIEERKLKIIQKKHEFHQAVFKGAVADQATSARMSREDLLYILGG